MTLIRPQLGETTVDFLRRLTRRFILLNVIVEGVQTSVCVNKQAGGAGAWRRKEECKRIELDLNAPGFSVASQTLALTFDDVNILANNFHTVFEAIPWFALNKQGNATIGNIPRDGAEMGQLLTNLEKLSEDILDIQQSLEHAIDTPIHALYRSVGRRELLVDADGLSHYGTKLLAAFAESQTAYEMIPALRGFGNGIRISRRPGMRGALLRYYMQHNATNPLGSSRSLDFVDYELKPLHISNTLRWNCLSDPRTESVDLLLSLNSSPVITEVKMAGDAFVSAAVVQLLYYASILTNRRQQARVNREFQRLSSGAGWLCILAEKRDESKANERGFGADLLSAIAFLRNKRTCNALAPYFQGALVLCVEETDEPFCSERGIPRFRVVDDGETIVEFAKHSLFTSG